MNRANDWFTYFVLPWFEQDFIKDSDPDMPAEEKKKLAERMDMR